MASWLGVIKYHIFTFIDDCFDFTFIYLLKNKNNALDAFKLFVYMKQKISMIEMLKNFLVIRELSMIQIVLTLSINHME